MFIKVSVNKGDKLIKLRNDAAAGISYGCRRGVCGKCIIKVRGDADALNNKTEIEEITLAVMGKNDMQHRLACQCRASNSTVIEISPLN